MWITGVLLVLTHCHIFFPRHSPLNIPMIIHQWWSFVICFCATGAMFLNGTFSIQLGSAGTKKSATPPVFPTGKGIRDTVKIPGQTPTHPRNWDSLNKNLNWNLFQIHVWKLGRRFKIFQVYTFWLFNISMDNCKCIDHYDDLPIKVLQTIDDLWRFMINDGKTS